MGALHRRLADLGFYYTPVDDVYGKQTERAVSRYQAYLNQLRGLDGAVAERFPDAISEGGRLTSEQLEYLFSEAYTPYPSVLLVGDEGQAVYRLQLRLDQLGYLSAAPNGVYGDGTARAVVRFQRRAGLPETGDADPETQRALFGSDAPPAVNPIYHYRLYISNDEQRVYAYAWSDGGYHRLAREMICSSGLPNTPTSDGVFRSEGQVSRWCYFPIYGCWAQYAFRIDGGVLFHSVLYDAANENTLRVSSLKSLGSKSSHGCVRLTVEDARWIYENCRAGTTVVVY